MLLSEFVLLSYVSKHSGDWERGLVSYTGVASAGAGAESGPDVMLEMGVGGSCLLLAPAAGVGGAAVPGVGGAPGVAAAAGVAACNDNEIRSSHLERSLPHLSVSP